MDEDELEKLGITGRRLKLAMMLKSIPADVIMIIIIILFAVLMVFYFSFVDTFFKEEEYMFQFIEMGILGLFVIEIMLHIIAYGKHYMSDCWNIFDIIIIILSLAFLFLDIFAKDDSLRGVLQIRGIFRLVRILILLRKLNTLRVKRDA
jgi:hypothetical protein